MQPSDDSGIDAAAKAELGASTRSMLKPLIEKTRAGLEPGEGVMQVALGRGSTAGFATYVPGTVVFFVVFVALLIVIGDDQYWTAFIVAFPASVLVDTIIRRRQRKQLFSRALVTVTDRRLLQLLSPDELTEIPLDSVREVEVRRGGVSFATVRIRSDQGETDVEVMSDWPKRGAHASAEAVAAAVRSVAPPARTLDPDG